MFCLLSPSQMHTENRCISWGLFRRRLSKLATTCWSCVKNKRLGLSESFWYVLSMVYSLVYHEGWSQSSPLELARWIFHSFFHGMSWQLKRVCKTLRPLLRENSSACRRGKLSYGQHWIRWSHDSSPADLNEGLETTCLEDLHKTFQWEIEKKTWGFQMQRRFIYIILISAFVQITWRSVRFRVQYCS